MNVKINDSTESLEFKWLKPQLLTSISNEEFLYFDGKGNPESADFIGLDLTTGSTDIYFKKHFKPFNGTITLSNY